MTNEIKRQVKLLYRDGYHCAAEIIEKFSVSINKNAEMEYIKEFLQEGIFDYDLSMNQLRSLWTAFCLHHRIDVDTYEYDTKLLFLWRNIPEKDKKGVMTWEDFDRFMCEYLV